MQILLLLLCALIFGDKLLSNFVTNLRDIIEDEIREEPLRELLQDAKLDPELIDDEPIYPDIEGYFIDLSDSLNLTPPGKSIVSVGKSSKNHERLAEFYLDSGCGAHVVNDILLLDNVKYTKTKKSFGEITGSAAGTAVKIVAVGTISSLGRVLDAPHLSHNLLSIGLLLDNNYPVNFSKTGCLATNGSIFFNGNIQGKKLLPNQFRCFIQVRNKDNHQSIKRIVSSSNTYEEVIHLGCLVATVAVSELEEILTDPVSLRNDLLLDSGCWEHMFNTARLTNFVRYNVSEKFVVVANRSKVPVMDEERCGILRRVFYVPRLSHS